MTTEQLQAEKKSIEAELAKNGAERKAIKKRLAAIETLTNGNSGAVPPAAPAATV